MTQPKTIEQIAIECGAHKQTSIIDEPVIVFKHDELLAYTKAVQAELIIALQPAIGKFHMEYLELYAKYAGTPFENDDSYQRIKSRYDNAIAALSNAKRLVGE